MAANCEKLKVTLTGYDCQDLMHAVKMWLKKQLSVETRATLETLHDKIEYQYNNTPREECDGKTS